MYMPFGKHRGRLIEDVPHSYLLWVLDNCERISPTLRDEIRHELGIDKRRQPQSPPPQTGQALSIPTINEWYRHLAREFHPDLGGSHEGMKAVNRARELMLELVNR